MVESSLSEMTSALLWNSGVSAEYKRNKQGLQIFSGVRWDEYIGIVIQLVRVCASGSSFFTLQGDFKSRQISLCSLYGSMVCVFVNEKAAKMHLLSLQNESMVLTFAAHLF